MKIKELPYHLLSISTLVCLFLLAAGCTSKPIPIPTVNPEGTPSDTSLHTETLETTSTPLDPYFELRQEMVRQQIEARGVADQAVLMAMRSVLRHEFVIDPYLDLAYDDTPLPINHGQTISQPYIVAWMSELLAVQPGDRVLEIGTGSGYQAAILATLGVEVFSVEIIPELAQEAAHQLDRLG
ncbi:MAG: protein-L-isoaspartate O-methyltransferase, partial [Anaerolineales bacterium]|nr:protein-L-isoaspartate O-methyltransferase [Anaerolineales bacterium]